MYKVSGPFIVIVTSIFFIASCAKVPITNRKQTNLLSEATLIEMSVQQYNQFLSEVKVLPENDQRSQRVLTVGRKIQKATEDFLTKKGYASRIEGFVWEYKTVEDKTVNAWCMPGGKVCVYTGF